MRKGLSKGDVKKAEVTDSDSDEGYGEEDEPPKEQVKVEEVEGKYTPYQFE